MASATYALPSIGMEAVLGDADGATGSLVQSVGRDAAYIGNFGIGFRQQAGENFVVDLGGIYSGTALGGFSAHMRCDIYQATFAFRARAFPSAEQVIVGLGTSTNPSYAGVITIDQTGTIRLYNYAGGTFASRQDVAALNGQANPVVTADGTWYLMQFYIDFGEPGGLATPAAVALAVAQENSGPTVISINPTSGFFLPAGGGLGTETGYLSTITFMASAGFTAPLTYGEYDFDALTVIQHEQDPAIAGPMFWNPYIIPGALQVQDNLTTIFASQIIAPGAWTMNDGSPVSVLALRDTGGSLDTSGAIKCNVANSPITVRFTLPPGFIPTNPSGYRISIFTNTYGVGNAATISVDGGTPVNIFLGTGFWSSIWVRNITAAGGADITLTHPNDGGNMVIQNIVVQMVGIPAPPSPSSFIKVASGTYVGNSLAQSIACGFKPDWIFIGPADASSKGVLWWESMVFPQDWCKAALRSAEMTPTLTGFDVVGPAATTNLTGVTYRWYAITDVQRRGVFRGASSDVFGSTRTLGSPLTAYNCPPISFPTVALWAQKDGLNSLNNAEGGYYRGPGHTGQNSNPLNATQNTRAIRSLPGATWEAGSDITQCEPQMSFTAWSLSFLAQKLWAIQSYTGDGNAGTRTIPIDLGGYYPGWCLIVPHNATSYVRHSSLAPTVSQDMPFGSPSNTAIELFISDGVIVGPDMNTLGVVYDLFAIIDPSSTPTSGPGTCVGICTVSDPPPNPCTGRRGAPRIGM